MRCAGIGYACAESIARNGGHVIIAARDLERSKMAANMIEVVFYPPFPPHSKTFDIFLAMATIPFFGPCRYCSIKKLLSKAVKCLYITCRGPQGFIVLICGSNAMSGSSTAKSIKSGSDNAC